MVGNFECVIVPNTGAGAAGQRPVLILGADVNVVLQLVVLFAEAGRYYADVARHCLILLSHSLPTAMRNCSAVRHRGGSLSLRSHAVPQRWQRQSPVLSWRAAQLIAVGARRHGLAGRSSATRRTR